MMRSAVSKSHSLSAACAFHRSSMFSPRHIIIYKAIYQDFLEHAHRRYIYFWYIMSHGISRMPKRVRYWFYLIFYWHATYILLCHISHWSLAFNHRYCRHYILLWAHRANDVPSAALEIMTYIILVGPLHRFIKLQYGSRFHHSRLHDKWSKIYHRRYEYKTGPFPLWKLRKGYSCVIQNNTDDIPVKNTMQPSSSAKYFSRDI